MRSADYIFESFHIVAYWSSHFAPIRILIFRTLRNIADSHMSLGYLYCQSLHVYNARKTWTLSPRKFQNVQFILLLLSFNFFPFREQNIVNTVGEEIKRLLEIFEKRNPMFNGKYSVCGHSLGRKWQSPHVSFSFLYSFGLNTGNSINVILFWSYDTAFRSHAQWEIWNSLADRIGHFRAALSFCFKAL